MSFYNNLVKDNLKVILNDDKSLKPISSRPNNRFSILEEFGYLRAFNYGLHFLQSVCWRIVDTLNLSSLHDLPC